MLGVTRVIICRVVQFCTNEIKPNINVISIGIGSDITFDVEMVQKYQSNIWALGPTITPKHFHSLVNNSSIPIELYKKFKFHPFGLGDVDTVIPFYRATNKALGSRIITPGVEGYYNTPEFYTPKLTIQTLQFITKLKQIDKLKVDLK